MIDAYPGPDECSCAEREVDSVLEQSREDPITKDGRVTFNHLQQSVPDTSSEGSAPDTTDPWGITTG